MGMFDGLFRKKALQPVNNGGGWRSLIHEPFTGAWQQNQELAREDLLSFHAVFSCVSLISKDVGKLWLNLKQEKNGILETVKDERFKFLQKPNHFQTRQQFFESWMISKLTRGNTYVLKYRDAFGYVIKLFVLNPDLVTPLVDDNGNVFYQVNSDKLAGLDRSFTFPASEIIHDRWNCFYHPLVGLSPIMACGLAAGQGIAIQKNAINLFKNMSRPSGILVAPGSIDKEKAKEVQDRWNANYSAGNYGKTAFMGDGITYIPLNIPAADAQMLEQLKLTGEVVCSTFHIPAFKVGLGAIPAGSKVGDLNEIYYSDCLQSPVEAIENVLTQDLELEKYGYSVEFDLDAIIRMDSMSQIEYLEKGVKATIFAPNEARKKLNLPPAPGGDSPMSQQQNYSLAALAKRDAKDDPFAKSGTESPVQTDTTADKSVRFAFNSMYQGVFSAAVAYKKGCFVTKNGSLWHCDTDHQGEFDRKNFTLAVKQGDVT